MRCGDPLLANRSDVSPATCGLSSPAGHATLIDFGFVQTPAEASQWVKRLHQTIVQEFQSDRPQPI